MNQPQLSQKDWRMLNRWLLSARLEDLHALSPAFKQAVSLVRHDHPDVAFEEFAMQALHPVLS